MKANKYTTLLIALLMGSTALQAQQAKLFFDTSVDCLNNKYCATINLQAINNTEFEVGTSSILINYNKDALTFASYESHNFDDKTLAQFGSETIKLYDEHVYDALIPGIINTTMTLTIPGYGEPTVKEAPLEVATICFDIQQMGENSGLSFHHKHTNFNKGGIANVELVSSLDAIHSPEILKCAEQTPTSIQDAIANEQINALSVTPNPFKETINLNINAVRNDDVAIQLYDVKGQLVNSINSNIFAGENALKIEASDLPSGIYLLEIKGAELNVSMKLLKE